MIFSVLNNNAFALTKTGKLVTAVEWSNVEKVQKYLKKGASPNKIAKYNWLGNVYLEDSAIQVSLRNLGNNNYFESSLKILEELLKAGAKFQLTDYFKYKLNRKNANNLDKHDSRTLQVIKTMEQFSQFEIDYNTKSTGHYSPLMYAIYFGDYKSASYLIEKGAKIFESCPPNYKCSPIAMLVQNPKPSSFEEQEDAKTLFQNLLKHGQGLNRSIDANNPLYGESLLNAALHKEWRPDHNDRNFWGTILIENGARPFTVDAKNENYETVYASLEQLKLLHNKGVNLGTLNKKGQNYYILKIKAERSYSWHVFYQKEFDFIQSLGIDINHRDFENNSALSIAFTDPTLGYINGYDYRGMVIPLLLQKGASPFYFNKETNKIVWDLPIFNMPEYLKIVRDYRNTENQSHIILATIKGDIRSVLIMMRLGVDKRAVDVHGYTAYKYAEEMGNKALMLILQ
jgi:ankyrin repeat protein